MNLLEHRGTKGVPLLHRPAITSAASFLGIAPRLFLADFVAEVGCWLPRTMIPSL
jgi:hypothetical protein